METWSDGMCFFREATSQARACSHLSPAARYLAGFQGWCNGITKNIWFKK